MRKTKNSSISGSHENPPNFLFSEESDLTGTPDYKNDMMAFIRHVIEKGEKFDEEELRYYQARNQGWILIPKSSGGYEDCGMGPKPSEDGIGEMPFSGHPDNRHLIFPSINKLTTKLWDFYGTPHQRGLYKFAIRTF